MSLTNLEILEILKKEVVPALGCTEPTAIAFAVAKAREVLGKKGEKVDLVLSGNMLKNAMSVGIPGTGMKGVDVAAALGLVAGDASRGLEVLMDISQENIDKAKELSLTNFITKSLSTLPNRLYIKATVIDGTDSASVEIKDFHTAITKIEKNGEVLLDSKCDETPVVANTPAPATPMLTIEGIYEFATTVDLSEIKFMEDAIELNSAIAEEGLKNSYGLEVGRTRMKSMEAGLVGDTLETYAMALTSAAADARMAGSTMAVMTNSGSGNQGITAIVPVIAAAKKLNVSHEQLLRAVTLSSLVAIHMKKHLGRLSALCGCVIASTGSACGTAYLMGGEEAAVVSTIKNVLGNITGMFCDGAKPGCSLKIATGVSAGIQAALLAKEGITIGSDEGIIDSSIEKTIENACRIGRDAMQETDRTILDIMISKDN